MGHAISSADLDSDHNLRNEKLSKIIETSKVEATTEGSEPAKDADPVKTDAAKSDSKANEKKSGAQTSSKGKATTEGSE